MEPKITDYDYGQLPIIGLVPTWKYYTVFVKNNLPEIMNRIVSECNIYHCLPSITHIGTGNESGEDAYLIGVISDEQDKVEKILLMGEL